MKLAIALPLTAALVILSGEIAFASKADAVRDAFKTACSKDVPADAALRMVKDLYLSCTPGTKVSLDGCQVPCLKDNAGAVVGQ